MDHLLFPQWTTDSNNCVLDYWPIIVILSFHFFFWKNMQSCNRHTTKFKQWAAEEGEIISKTYCFSSTEWNLTLRNAQTSKAVYVCTFVCVFSSVTAPHGDYCIMWITWHCWVFSVVHRATGVKWKNWQTNPNSEVPWRGRDLTRQCCLLVGTMNISDIYYSHNIFISFN